MLLLWLCCSDIVVAFVVAVALTDVTVVGGVVAVTVLL